MKLLIDMNLSPRWVDFLSKAGFDAVHWSALGPSSAADSLIMQFASENGRVVLTHDLDFRSILAATGGVGPSVVQVRAEDVRPEAIGDQVIETCVGRKLSSSAAHLSQSIRAAPASASFPLHRKHEWLP